MKSKILISVPHYEERCKEGVRILEENDCELIITQNGRPYTFEELKEIVGDIDAVIAGVDTWDAAIFEYAKKLKGIARFGIGVDNFNLEDMKQYGIHASNTPGINRNSVAEHAVTLLLCTVRNIPRLNKTTREGAWERFITHELQGQTLGLLGFGGIARSVAEKMKPFGVHILAFDTFPNEAEAERLGVTLCSMEEVLAKSDIISIHVPCTDETRGLICKETIAKMKDGVFLINTARGPIVKEDDLYEALVSGKIAAHGTDVFEKEPVDLNHPLFGLENYVCTPHTAAESYENYALTGAATARAVVAMLKGEEPENMLV
ncbi:MAG: phosphoglycerate dehydrogenase [Lachnospiraceae bacterium]|nr:phosphoglycerate dehydrogenase [Lachnospiraceae bacterium]